MSVHIFLSRERFRGCCKVPSLVCNHMALTKWKSALGMECLVLSQKLPICIATRAGFDISRNLAAAMNLPIKHALVLSGEFKIGVDILLAPPRK